jgi:methylisocitrate lyase
MKTNAAKLRGLLASRKLIVAPGAYDAFTARIIESLGFPAVYAGGNATGTHLNTPEPFLSATDMIEHATRIVRAVDVPLIIDAGAGFGDRVHVYRAVRDFERAGIAGMHVEDQVYPKRADYFSGSSKKGFGRTHVIPLPDMLDKMKAALDARTDPDFVIIGRTDALATPGGIDEVFERCNALKEIGVDMILVTGQPTPEQGVAIRKAVTDIPLMWISGIGLNDLSRDQVADMGYQLMVYSTTAAVLVADGFLKAFTHVRDHGTLGMDLEHILDVRKRIMEILRMPEYWSVESADSDRSADGK